ncbi:MAG: hypothetical protein WD050_03270 [Actinomycetota bacterium]
MFERFTEYEHIRLLDEWWERQKFASVTITPVGVALAYANIKRHMPEVEIDSLESFLQ